MKTLIDTILAVLTVVGFLPSIAMFCVAVINKNHWASHAWFFTAATNLYFAANNIKVMIYYSVMSVVYMAIVHAFGLTWAFTSGIVMLTVYVALIGVSVVLFRDHILAAKPTE